MEHRGMKLFLRYQWLVVVAAAALTAIHPLIHNTPLDSGALDGILVALQSQAVTR